MGGGVGTLHLHTSSYFTSNSALISVAIVTSYSFLTPLAPSPLAPILTHLTPSYYLCNTS